MLKKSHRLSSSYVGLALIAPVAIIALVTIIGWHLDPSRAPAATPHMKYNTAWSFFLISLAYAAHYRGLAHVARVTGAIVLGVATLSLAQRLFGFNLGIDELIVNDPYIPTEAHPGRMAPLTALGLMVLGAVMIWPRFAHSVFLAGVAVVAASLVIALSYFGANTPGIAWYQQIGYGVAPTSALSLLLMGLASIHLSWKYLRAENCTLCIPGMLFIGVIALTVVLWQGMQADLEVEREQRTKLVAEDIRHHISSLIEDRIKLLEQLGKLSESQEEPGLAWLQHAQSQLAKFAELSALARVNAAGIVEEISARSPSYHQQLLENLNARTPHSGQVSLAAPNHILLNVPHQKNDRQSSATAALLNIPQIFNSLTALRSNMFAIQVWEGQRLIYSKEPGAEAGPLPGVSQLINLPGTVWRVYIQPVAQGNRVGYIFPQLVLAGGFLLAVLLAIASYHAQDARRQARGLRIANAKLTNEIAQHVQTQNHLADVRRELVDFMETAVIGLYWLDAKGIILWANQAEYALLEYTHEEYVGHPFWEFYVQPKQAYSLLEQMNSGVSLNSVEISLRTKSGNIKHVALSSRPFYRSDQFVHTRCFSRDITERRAAEQALRENMERFRLSLDNSLDAFIVMNDKGRIVEWSAQSEMMFGWSRDEVIDKPLVEIIIPFRFREAHNQGMERFFATGLGPVLNKHIELTALRRNGQEFPVELSIIPIKWRNSYIFSSFVHDITERKQAQRDLEVYMQKLMQSNRDLQDFAYVSSHDLQEPLRKIRAFSERLSMMHKHELSPQAKDYISRMQTASVRMQNLINDLLTYSRVSSHARPFTEVDLSRVVQEVLQDLELSIEQTQARISVGRLPTIKADKPQMQQLFQNLISNALKFHKRDQVPEVTISCRYLDAGKAVVDDPLYGGYVELTVADKGIGFDSKYAEHIFATFQRLHTRKEFEGTGIGLAICRKIALHHGGSISAHGEPGKGARFVIILPLDQPKGKTDAG